MGYEDVDAIAYDQLIQAIYSDKDIARIKLGDHCSFLTMSLWNPNLKLTEEQKKGCS